MKVNVLDVREHPQELDFELSRQDLALDNVEEVEFVAPIVGHLKLSAVGETILANGRIATRVKLVCVRCLKEFEAPLECQNVQVRFTPRPARPETDEVIVDVEADEEEVKHFDSNEIDLTEELRELLLLAAPSYPHCSSGCQLHDSQQQQADQESPDKPLPEWKTKLKKIQLD